MTSHVAKLNQQSSLVDSIRIVHEDAVAILPDGKITMYKDIGRRRPLLVLNPDELTREKAMQVYDSGFYRKRFADDAPLKYEELLEKQGIISARDYDGVLFRRELWGMFRDDSVAKKLRKSPRENYEMILEDFYDQLTRPIMHKGTSSDFWRSGFVPNLDSVLRKCERLHTREMHNIRKHRQNIKLTVMGVEWAHLEEGERQERADEVKGVLRELPPFMLEFLNTHHVEIQDIAMPFAINKTEGDFPLSVLHGQADPLRNTVRLINSGYGLKLNMEDKDPEYVATRMRSAAIEEIIHKIDHSLSSPDALMWSDSAAWREAMAAEIPEALGTIDKLRTRLDGKAPLFSQKSEYRESSRACEFLANIACLDMCPPKGISPETNRAILLDALPHTYPLYEQFIAEAKRAVEIEKTKLERAEKRQVG